MVPFHQILILVQALFYYTSPYNLLRVRVHVVILAHSYSLLVLNYLAWEGCIMKVLTFMRWLAVQQLSVAWNRIERTLVIFGYRSILMK